MFWKFDSASSSSRAGGTLGIMGKLHNWQRQRGCTGRDQHKQWEAWHGSTDAV